MFSFTLRNLPVVVGQPQPAPDLVGRGVETQHLNMKLNSLALQVIQEFVDHKTRVVMDKRLVFPVLLEGPLVDALPIDDDPLSLESYGNQRE